VSTATKADPAKPAGSAHSLSTRRPLGDRGFQLLALLAGLLVLAILIGIAVSTAQQGSNWFSTAGFSGIFSTVWNPGSNQC
jgi:ABC-type phosphate transport system permease subunit